MILQGFNLLFGAVSIFLKDIEKTVCKTSSETREAKNCGRDAGKQYKKQV